MRASAITRIVIKSIVGHAIHLGRLRPRPGSAAAAVGVAILMNDVSARFWRQLEKTWALLLLRFPGVVMSEQQQNVPPPPVVITGVAPTLPEDSPADTTDKTEFPLSQKRAAETTSATTTANGGSDSQDPPRRDRYSEGKESLHQKMLLRTKKNLIACMEIVDGMKGDACKNCSERPDRCRLVIADITAIKLLHELK